jgi:antitoxin ParD1/3/4
MNVSLTPELEAFVTRKVKSGLYQTASEVVRDGLRLLREQDELHQQRLKDLRRAIDKGVADANAGKVAPMDAEEILAEVRRRHAKRSRKDD